MNTIPRVVAHTKNGIVEIPETGDAKTDELLERIVRKAGENGRFPVTTATGEMFVADSERATREALREGA